MKSEKKKSNKTHQTRFSNSYKGRNHRERLQYIYFMTCSLKPKQHINNA